MTVLKLNADEEKKHDDVIEFVKTNLIKEGFKVRLNKSKNKTNDVDDTDENGDKITIFPDVYTIGEKYVERIYEVETKSSVVKSEVSQWKQYSRNVDFYLVVPEDKLEDAKKLVAEHNIKVKDFLTYT